MTPAEIQETIADLREKQAVICIHLGVWCRSPDNEAALARLADARAEEAKLFDIVLWKEPARGRPPTEFPLRNKSGQIDGRSRRPAPPAVDRLSDDEAQH
jgi:hypothetical protein